MLVCQNISYQYPKAQSFALKNVTCQLNAGQNLAIIGESGCGKSTLLKAIYGLIDLTSGTILFNQQKILGPSYHLVPGHPEMKYMAQDFELMPYIKVKENIGKFLSNFYQEKKANRVEELLQLVGMFAFAETMTNHLSGGQKQRVALAQALAQEPSLLLLDEPFSHIDQCRKNDFRRELFAYFKDKNIACIVATHDMTDVLPFADHIMVLKNSQVVQYGETKLVYQQPINIEVAKLFGDANQVSEGLVKALNLPREKKVLYPSELKISVDNGIEFVIINKYFQGSYYLYQVRYNDENLLFESEKDLPIGSFVRLDHKK